MDGLLHPAAALVTGDVRNDPQAVLERDRDAPLRQALQLHDDDHFLPDVGPELDPGGTQLRAVPGHGRLGGADRPGRLDDAVRQRLGAPDRSVHLEPAAQRLSARARGLRRSGGHDDVRALRPGLRTFPDGCRTAPQELVRGDAQGRLVQPGHPVRHLPHPSLLHPGLRRFPHRVLRSRPQPSGDAHLGRPGPADHGGADRLLAAHRPHGEEEAARRTTTAAGRRTGPRPVHSPQERPGRLADDQTVQIALGGRER